MRVARKLARHLRWARTEGLARLVEEDRLNLRDRFEQWEHKTRWRRANPRPAGAATPVFVVGLQRSGTNMVVRGLERAPEIEVHSENDRAAFADFRLRSDDVVRRLVDRSRHDFVLFKPLCDSHRTVELLDLCGPSTGRAVWVYRGVDGRVRSSVAKFGDSNLQVLRRIAAGAADNAWEAGGLDAADVALLRSLPLHIMDAESGSALFWYLRNRIYFTAELDRREDVALVSYDDFRSAPEATMRSLCDTVGLTYRGELVAHIRAAGLAETEPLMLHPSVRALCAEMEGLLDAHALGSRAG